MRQMTLDEIESNVSVDPADELRLTEQAKKIYHKLLQGKVSNNELSEIALQYNARLYEIRRALWPHRKTVKLVEKNGTGLNFYAIVEV